MLAKRQRRLYADHTRVRGELSPEEVAADIGCSVETVRRAARRALALEDGPISEADVRRDVSGRLWLRDSVVDPLRNKLLNRAIRTTHTTETRET